MDENEIDEIKMKVASKYVWSGDEFLVLNIDTLDKHNEITYE